MNNPQADVCRIVTPPAVLSLDAIGQFELNALKLLPKAISSLSAPVRLYIRRMNVKYSKKIC
jgi:hypothetical protein